MARRFLRSPLVGLLLFLPLLANVQPSIAQAQQCGSWAPVAQQANPPSRLRQAMAYHTVTQTGVMFGGTGIANGHFEILGDTWLWDSADGKWTGPLDLAVKPPARFSGAMAYDPDRGVIVLFGGGGDNDAPLGDTWEFDGAKWKNVVPAVSPPARFFHNVVYNSALRKILVFGGNDGATILADTWAYDGATWTKLSDSVPPARELAVLADDTARSRTVLFAGFQSSGYLDDTWEFDGATWQQKVVQGPLARLESFGNFIPTIARTLIFGGLTFQNNEEVRLGDTWTWDGSTWQELPITGPSARRGPNGFYDSLRQGTVIFGGTNDSGLIFGDTWQFTVPDSDSDGTADCLDQCPTDPQNIVPGVCGCGFVQLNGSCVNSIFATTPAAPILKMVGKKVRVQMTPMANVRYVVRYFEVKRLKKGKKPKFRQIVKDKPTIAIANLKKDKKYTFSYKYRLKTPGVAGESPFSPTKSIKVKFKKTPKKRR